MKILWQVISLLCKITQTPYSHLVFIPLIDKVVNSAKEDRKKWIIAFVFAFWLWFLCEGEHNSFLKTSGGLGNHLVFMFIAVYAISKITHFEGLYKYTFSALISYVAAIKLAEYTTFLVPITEIFGNILNPLLYLPIESYNDDHYDHSFGDSEDY